MLETPKPVDKGPHQFTEGIERKFSKSLSNVSKYHKEKQEPKQDVKSSISNFEHLEKRVITNSRQPSDSRPEEANLIKDLIMSINTLKESQV